MKKLLFTVFVLLTTQMASSQITLEKTFSIDSGSLIGHSYVNFSQFGYKLMETNRTTGEIVLYNDDYTVFKKIQTALRSSTDQIINLYHMSDHLFNLDDKIEYLISYQGNSTTISKFVIYNESGEVLFERLGAISPYIAFLGNETKMQFRVTEKVNGINTYKDEIYSLPGNLPLSVTDVSVTKNNYDVKLFPNPVNNNKINIAYTLPDNIKVSKVTIYNTLGQVVKTVKPDKNSTEIDIDTQNLEKGTYFCELMGNKGKISASKFIVQ